MSTYSELSESKVPLQPSHNASSSRQVPSYYPWFVSTGKTLRCSDGRSIYDLPMKSNGICQRISSCVEDSFHQCRHQKTKWLPVQLSSSRLVHVNQAATQRILPELKGDLEETDCLEKFFLKKAWQETKPSEAIHLSRSKNDIIHSYHLTPKGLWQKEKSRYEPVIGATKKFKRAKECWSDRSAARLVSHKKASHQNLANECAILEQLVGCRGVVQIYDHVCAPNKRDLYTFTIYEELFDTTLEGLRVNSKENRDQIMEDLIHGLWNIHKNNIAHNDIKELNILVRINPTGSYSAAICDFDLASRSDTEVKWIRGTPFYCSPEKIYAAKNNKPFTLEQYKRSDVWALGLVFYRLYGLQLPSFWFDNSIHGNKLIKRLVEPGSFFPEPKGNPQLHLIWEMLQYNPANRPSMDTVLKKWQLSSEPPSRNSVDE